MIDYDEFTTGKNWAFIQSINGSFIVSSSFRPDGIYEIMAARGDGGLDYDYREGAEKAYAAVIAGLARHAAIYVERNPCSRDGSFRVEHLVDLAVERGGFRPGTYVPYGVVRRVACAFVSEALPDAMLLAAAPYYSEDRAAETALVQVERKDGEWFQAAELSPELVEAVERSYCQWAKEALVHEGLVRSPVSEF